jgi:hypothetical protein
MKNIVLIMLIVFSSLKCSSQDYVNAWLPEEYVKSTIAKKTNAIKFLMPIEGFESPFKNGYVLTFKGELNPIKAKKVTINGKVKYRLPSFFYSYFNLEENSIELVNKIKVSTIYISKTRNKLLLEIIEKDKKEEIFFIDRINGYKFKNINLAKKYLQNKYK